MTFLFLIFNSFAFTYPIAMAKNCNVMLNRNDDNIFYPGSDLMRGKFEYFNIKFDAYYIFLQKCFIKF